MIIVVRKKLRGVEMGVRISEHGIAVNDQLFYKNCL
jgi:hypothetical protein